MKKSIVLVLACVAITTSTFGQFKPESDDIVFGLGLQSPFATGSPLSLVNGGINVRKFMSTDQALRVSCDFNMNSNTNDLSDSIPDPDNAGEMMLLNAYQRSSNSNLNLRVGMEKHMSGSSRLSPYAGADLILGIGNSVEKHYNNINGSLEDGDSWKQSQISTSIGLNLAAGIDFYIFPGVYVGTEFGWSFIRTGLGKTKVLEIDKEVDETSETETYTNGSSSLIARAGMSTGAFRIGFILK